MPALLVGEAAFDKLLLDVHEAEETGLQRAGSTSVVFITRLTHAFKMLKPGRAGSRPASSARGVDARAIAAAILLAVAIPAGVVASATTGALRDFSLNVVAETFGVGIVLFVVDRLIERQGRRQLYNRRQAAIEDLRFVLVELQGWLARLYFQSRSGLAYWVGSDPNRVPLEAFIEQLPEYLGTIDFASSGVTRRDRYFIEWVRRTFEVTVRELERWERNFAGAAGIFEDDFRVGTERLHSFVRAVRSFTEGMEVYINREEPTGPVRAYEGITELTEESVSLLVVQLRDFLAFYRGECARYRADIPDLAIILK